MKYIFISSVLIVLLLCSCRKGKTDLVLSSQVEMQDSLRYGKEPPTVIDSINAPESSITAEMAYEAVSDYCHSAYDWSIAEGNPSMMYVTMGEETESEYKVIFRSYTGAFVYFYVDKASGVTRMVEHVPAIGVENEIGNIDLFGTHGNSH